MSYPHFEAPAARHSQRGFTLIELMVVILIIGLLATAILPNIIAAQDSAKRQAVEGNLRWHYQAFLSYESRYKRLPAKSGVEFVVAPWVKKTVDRTKENFDRYYLNNSDIDKEALIEDVEGDFKLIWDGGDVQVNDTHFAGPNRKIVKRFDRADTPMMASHDPYVAALKGGETIVLLKDGNTRQVFGEDFGYEDDEQPVPIGEDSDHELLRKLTR